MEKVSSEQPAELVLYLYSDGELQHSPPWERHKRRKKEYPKECLQTFHLCAQSQERPQTWLLLHWPWSPCENHLSLQGHPHSCLPSLLLLSSSPTIQCLQILFQLLLHVKRAQDQGWSSPCLHYPPSSEKRITHHCFSHRLSWLSPNLLASAGSVNMTVVEMANQKATGIYVFVSRGMSFYTAWKVSSTIDDMTIKPVRGDRNCHAPLECFTMISSKQSPPLQRPQCLCPLEDDLVWNLTGKFSLPPFFPFPFSQQPLNIQGK